MRGKRVRSERVNEGRSAIPVPFLTLSWQRERSEVSTARASAAGTVGATPSPDEREPRAQRSTTAETAHRSQLRLQHGVVKERLCELLSPSAAAPRWRRLQRHQTGSPAHGSSRTSS